MEALRASSFPSLHRPILSPRNSNCKTQKPISHIPLVPSLPSIQVKRSSNFKIFTAISPIAPSTEELLSPDQEIESETTEEKFDWYAHWYPIVPVIDLDKRRPHGKKVIGMDIVIWWDKNDNAWKVFDDSCPHRLAPLSEGRIDQWGRLQCVYHGWCFGGSGDCKFIPQAPRDGPPVHTSNKACVAAYPSCVQNGILWFWPNSDPQYKNIHSKKKPHYIPELDDPSYTNLMICRDIPYGYEILIENLMDPAHADREGGRPLEIGVQKLDVNGFTSKQMFGENYFIPPCLYYGYFSPAAAQSKNSTSSAGTKDERKLAEVGARNWQKACYVPTKSDVLVVSFRRWLNKYGGTQVDWKTNFSRLLPPTPPREQLFDRYWSHTVNCSSCSFAYKALHALEIGLQIISVSSIGIIAAAKQGVISVAARYSLVAMAILCFVASKWLSHFVYKTFRYHDYDHAFV
ncbi:hypothetical protein RD792_005870 [Penstemon davidsonii]|uniref:Rieske domain-containing protein n=1 Tax=Penstemon davidsonii TaxID=160366 RepID=A0ABR0DE21_9LAMI|nr:hypothetical protein RD792_005870 [Penstemon davidsonii]